MHRRCTDPSDDDREWIPAWRLLMSASERMIQALVAYISRRDAGIHSPSSFSAPRHGGAPMDALRRLPNLRVLATSDSASR